MRRHRAGDAPGRRKGERQQDHGSIDRDVRLDGGRDGRLGALHRGQHEKIDRQADQDMRRRPGKAGVAPADAFQSPGRQRPADGRGKTRDQRDAGDRAARGVAIDASQRAEGGVVQAKSHADAEQKPGDHQHRDRIGDSRAAPVPRPASDWKSTARTGRRRGRSAGRRAGRAGRKSPATPRRRQRSSSRKRRGRARSDRPGSPADSSSTPTPAFAWCRAPE